MTSSGGGDLLDLLGLDVPAASQPAISLGGSGMNGLSSGMGGGDSGIGLLDLLGGVGGGIPMKGKNYCMITVVHGKLVLQSWK